MAKMVKYSIEYSRKAESDLGWLTKRQCAVVLDAVDDQLVVLPTLETRNRKRLRPNPVVPWELRIGNLRVFYDVTDDPQPLVQVLAVGVKLGHRLLIGGETVDL